MLHWIGEVAMSMVGDTIAELLLPGRGTQNPPPEGEWNASLASLAAFLAGVAAPSHRGRLAANGPLRPIR
jgi:hypothetical protein